MCLSVCRRLHVDVCGTVWTSVDKVEIVFFFLVSVCGQHIRAKTRGKGGMVKRGVFVYERERERGRECVAREKRGPT